MTYDPSLYSSGPQPLTIMTRPTLLWKSDDGNQRLLYRCFSATGIELLDQELTEDGWEDINVVVLNPESARRMLPMLAKFVDPKHTMIQTSHAQLAQALDLVVTTLIRTVAAVQHEESGTEPDTSRVMHATLRMFSTDATSVVPGCSTEFVNALTSMGLINDTSSTGHRDNHASNDTGSGFGAGVLSQE